MHLNGQRAYHVYILARPNGKPFYVGCTCNPIRRLLDHEHEARRSCACPKCGIIRDIWRRGGTVQQTIVYTADDDTSAYAAEAEWTEAIGWAQLTNQVAGGRTSQRRSPALNARLRRLHQERAAQNAARSRAAREAGIQTWNRQADVIFRRALTIAVSAVAAGRILSLGEVASLLRVCSRVVKRLIHEGHIAGHRVSIRRWEVPAASVHAYLVRLGYVPGYALRSIDKEMPQ